LAANEWPDDRKLVLAAARLGWTLAEFAGCLRDTRPVPAEPGHQERKWLPLGQERSETEQLVEYTAVIDDLAVELNVQILAQDLPNAGRHVDETAAGWLKGAAFDLVVPTPTTPERAVIATDIVEFLYRCDARFQDRLSAREPLSAAYQLGRGVAEIRWGWAFGATDGVNRAIRDALLGKSRGTVIDRLLTRLAAYYDPITLNAIEWSLAEWRPITAALHDAPDEAWRNALLEQGTVWHDLILGQRDGASLVSPQDILSKPASLFPILSRLAPEVGLTAIGAVLLIAAAAWLASPGGENAVTAVAGVLGIAGVTAAGISAKARARAMNLIDTVREELYRGLVADKAVILPPKQLTAPRSGAAK
jgi:hypothetical protein